MVAKKYPEDYFRVSQLGDRLYSKEVYVSAMEKISN